MATYFVSDATGDDADDGLSEANAFLTIDKAMNTVAAGDKVWVKADGTYTEDALIDTVGTGTAHIIWEGYTTTPGDNGQVTMVAASVSCIAKGTAATFAFIGYVFRNFKFTGGSGDAFGAWSGNTWLFDNCEFSGAGAYGCGGGSANQMLFHNCVITGNTSGATNLEKWCFFIHCKIHGNSGTDGARCTNIIAIGCLVYDNAATNGANFQSDAAGSINILYGNTIDGENGTSVVGWEQTNSSPGMSLVMNNILYDCDKGVKRATAQNDSAVIGFNLINSNATADYENCENNAGGDVITAPNFTDEAGDDYTLGSSDAVDAGVDLGNV